MTGKKRDEEENIVLDLELTEEQIALVSELTGQPAKKIKFPASELKKQLTKLSYDMDKHEYTVGASK